MAEPTPLDPIPGTYGYVAQVQGAAKAIEKALAALSDQSYDGRAAAAAIVEARQRIENVWELQAIDARPPVIWKFYVCDVCASVADIHGEPVGCVNSLCDAERMRAVTMVETRVAPPGA